MSHRPSVGGQRPWPAGWRSLALALALTSGAALAATSCAAPEVENQTGAAPLGDGGPGVGEEQTAGAVPDAAGSSAAGSSDEPSGCSGPPPLAGDRTMSLRWQDRQRVYLLHVPAGYTGRTPVPLLIDLHGFEYLSAQQKGLSGFLPLSEEKGFLLAHPDGFQQSWNAGDQCCGAAQQLALDDVGLVQALIDQVAASFCVDRRRVYATGFSNGGMLSHRLACEANHLIAAVAPVAARIDLVPMSRCQPARPTPVMLYHGRNDPVVRPEAGLLTFEHWARVNHCTGAPLLTRQGGVACSRYVSCRAPVGHCSLEAAHVAYHNPDLSIAAHAWQFLSQHRLP